MKPSTEKRQKCRQQGIQLLVNKKTNEYNSNNNKHLWPLFKYNPGELVPFLHFNGPWSVAGSLPLSPLTLWPLTGLQQSHRAEREKPTSHLKILQMPFMPQPSQFTWGCDQPVAGWSQPQVNWEASGKDICKILRWDVGWIAHCVTWFV